MKINIKLILRLSVIALLSFAAVSTGMTAKCEPIDREKSISRILERNPGGKVLKIAEHTGKDGCARLKIRILVDGTVKAVTVKPKGT